MDPITVGVVAGAAALAWAAFMSNKTYCPHGIEVSPNSQPCQSCEADVANLEVICDLVSIPLRL